MVYITDSRGRLSLQMRLLILQIVGQGLAPAVSPMTHIGNGWSKPQPYHPHQFTIIQFVRKTQIYHTRHIIKEKSKIFLLQFSIFNLHCYAKPKFTSQLNKSIKLCRQKRRCFKQRLLYCFSLKLISR